MQASDSKVVQNSQATCLIQAGAFDQAIGLLATWLDEDPENLDFYDLIGRAYRNRGDGQDVIPLYSKATRAFPNLGLQRSPNFAERQNAGIEKGMPPIFLNTQFKSGSVFLRDALEKGLNIPYMFLSPQGISAALVDAWLEDFARGGTVCQHHRPVDQELFSKLTEFGIDKIWLHLRDPRQTTLSAIHHYSRVLVEGPESAKDELERHLPEGYFEWTMSEKIDHYLERHQELTYFSEITVMPSGDPAHPDPIQSLRKQILWMDEWLEKVDESVDSELSIRVIDFTDLKAGAGGYFRKLLAFFEIDEGLFDFSALPEKMKPGQGHFRKGETDEWRRVFSPKQIELANNLMTPRLLQRYGT